MPMNFNRYLKSILNGIMSLSVSFIGREELCCKYPWAALMFLTGAVVYHAENCSAVTL